MNQKIKEIIERSNKLNYSADDFIEDIDNKIETRNQQLEEIDVKHKEKE